MKKFGFLLILLAAVGLLFWFFYPLRSYAVMGIYSARHSADSVMRENGFEIKIPSGKGWYPFVMTYNADGFARWSGIDAEMSILYNFGAFDPATRTSSIYNPDSDKYSSFYGAYVVQKNGDDFGFKGDTVDFDELARVVEYDYTQLVMRDFGCSPQTFAADSFTMQPDTALAGNGGWTRIDAEVTANGAAHSYAGYRTPYLQYGPPTRAVDTDFAVTDMFGRIYAKYFDEYGCTVMVYVIAPDAAAADRCDQALLQKTTISALE